MINIVIIIAVLVYIILLLVLSTMVISLFSMYYNSKLTLYIYKKKPRRFKELFGNAKLMAFGGAVDLNPTKWGSNTVKGLRYLFSQEDTKDKTISKYKKRLRFCLKFTIISIILMFITTGIILLLGWYGGYWTS